MCSTEAALSHYLRLSTGAFQDFEFVLHAYDMIAQQKCYALACVQAKMKFAGITRAEAFAGLTQEQIAAAAKHKFECRQAAKRNRPNPSSDHLDPRAALFCRSIKTSSAAAQHTVDNADSARSQMFALHNSFGKPTWYAFIIDSLI